MINVYLRKLTVTNDVFLNDPTAFAVVVQEAPAPILDIGGPRSTKITWKRDVIRHDDEEVLVVLSQLLGAA